MSVSGIITEKQIYYDKNTNFKIIPKISTDDMKQFRLFLAEIKSLYSPTSNDNLLFWEFNEIDSKIIINETTNIVVNDIFNQLILLALWLFGKKYCLEGYFYCRIENIIEYIELDGISKFITHHILIDDLDEINEANCNSIIPDAKYKINKFIKKKLQTSNNIIPKNNIYNIKQFGARSNIFYENNIYKGEYKNNNNNIYNIKQFGAGSNIFYENNNDITHTISDSEIINENNIVIKTMQERLVKVENELQSLIKVNKFFWKICTVISLFTAGSLLIYLSMGEKK